MRILLAEDERDLGQWLARALEQLELGPGQRAIVLGKGGNTIKTISSESRKEISEIIEQPVHLFLFVKVRERWADDPERYRAMGLDFDPKI